MKPWLKALDTTVVGKVLPSFLEQYGDKAKNLDASFSFSHKLFKNEFPTAKMSGFQMDKNGNWKVTLNVAATMDLEKKKRSEEWTKIRDIYVTLDARFKIT